MKGGAATEVRDGGREGGKTTERVSRRSRSSAGDDIEAVECRLFPDDLENRCQCFSNRSAMTSSRGMSWMVISATGPVVRISCDTFTIW